LDDGEVDLYLIKPTGMDGRMDENQIGVTIPQSLHGPGTAVRRTVVDNPEHTAGIVVRRASHDLLDQAVEGSDAVLRLTATEDPGVVDIQPGNVGPGAAWMRLND